MRQKKFIPQTTISLEDLLSVIPKGAREVRIHNSLGIKPSDNDGLSVSWLPPKKGGKDEGSH